ncbi:hypothetical protein ATANTOWER_021829 [Ataeniobius toweri]|uniref:Uncharacterized protein n=1 Tax=Ataeniobius toweri TaxID=208326 RepID=A0ABU7C5D6_9TELE|nr:hypothetical protein [Ataeniobius toweri]
MRSSTDIAALTSPGIINPQEIKFCCHFPRVSRNDATEAHIWRDKSSQTCLTAHYGLWKGCTKTLWVADIDPERESCGPAELPGESNCTSFKFFTTGENTVMFQKTTEKNLNVAAAMLALFSLFLMVMGAICITMSLSKEILFFLKPASICFILSGVLVLLSLMVFHQSVLSFLASDHTIPLHHELSWSVSCIGCAGSPLTVTASSVAAFRTNPTLHLMI